MTRSGRLREAFVGVGKAARIGGWVLGSWLLLLPLRIALEVVLQGLRIRLGRSIVTKRYKYNLYDSGAHREQLTDLEADPGEMNNLAEDEKHRDVLKAHRALLRDCVQNATAVGKGDASPS